MSSSWEIKTLGLAMLVASLSLVGALLAALPMQMLMNSGSKPVETTGPSSSLEISSSPPVIEQGHQIFTMSCVECHGDDAHGDEGPDLHNLTISNDALAVMIQKGEKDQMPPFAKKYNDSQLSALVAYLRSLH